MDKFIEDQLIGYSPETRIVIEYMAINIKPIDYNDVLAIISIRIRNCKGATMKLVIEELRNGVSPVIYNKGTYAFKQTYGLKREFSLLLFRELVLSGKYSVQYANDDNSVSEKLAFLLLGVPVVPFTAYEMGDTDYEDAIRTALMLDSYQGIEKLLPSSYLCKFFQAITYSLVCNFGDVTIIDYWHNRLTTHFTNDILSLQTINMTYGIVTILIKGEIDKIPDYVTFQSDDGCYLSGIYYMYKGEYDLAATSFERGMKLAKKTNEDILPEFPLFTYGYVLSLILSSTPKLVKRRSVLLAKKPFQYNPVYLVAYIALNNKVYGNVPVYFNSLYSEYLRSNLLSGGLYLAVLKHFDSSLLKDENKLLKSLSKIDKDGYKLLALEIYSHFNEYQPQYTSLVQELGVTALLSRDVVLSDWEREIDKLLIKGSEEIERSDKLSKICYVVTPEQNFIQPILRTSSNGGKKWTKGRNIALKTLMEGVASDDMTELDKQISKCIVVQNGWYGATGYEIDTAKAIKFLVGNPNIYLNTNMDLAMEVTALKPEITINVTKDGYGISSNITNFTKPYKIIKESATRLNVLNLTTDDCNVLQALSNIKHLPFEAKDKLILLLKRLNQTMVVHSDLIDEGSVIRKMKSDSRAVVQLYPLGENLQAEFYVKPFTNTSPYCRAGIGAKSVMGVIDGEQVQALRDLNEECTMMNKLTLLLEPFSEIIENRCLYDTAEGALQLIEILRENADIALVEWPEGVKYKILAHVNSDALKLSLKSQNNWFEMEGALQIDENKMISIKSLIEIMRSSDGRFINIGENEFIALSDKLRKQLIEIEAITTVTKNTTKINKFALPILSGLSDDGCKIKTDKQFKELKKQVERAETINIDVPRGLKTELRDYQYKGFQWMARLAEWGAGGCLADDMGLGKTIQSIAMLLRMAEGGASLVVCPASVLPNWERELNKFAPSLNWKTLNSASDRKEQIDGAGAYDVVLSTYGLLVTEEELISGKEWQMVVLDEAHTIKNKETKTSKATMNLTAKFRLILTGTPIQNHLGEIWNLFNFINPGLLGADSEFLHKYITPIVQNKDKVCQSKLKRLMSPFLLRRTKSGVLDELPSKTEIVMRVEMSDSEMAYYETLRRKAEIMLEESLPSERLKVLSEITKLRMAACNISLVDKDFDFPSSKLEQFSQIVEELQQGDHTALVFSQFTSHLAIIKKHLDKEHISYLSLDGSTPIKERDRLVAEFQKGGHTLFLISLKAGGLGLNLTAADYVIHLDPWWNPAVEDQATDRAYRIGQQRAVTVFRLISKDTIEEKILRLHATKRDLADALLEGSDVTNALSKDELMFLLQNR